LKAVHSLSENKRFGHHPQAMFVLISAFLLFAVSATARGEKLCSLLAFLAYFSFFFKFCHNWITFSKNLSAHIILVLHTQELFVKA